MRKLELKLEREELDTDELKAVKNGLKIITTYFDQFSKKHYIKLKRQLGVNDEDLKYAIDEILRIAKKSLKQFRKMHPSSIYDIRKYYPHAWKIVEAFKSEFIYTCIKENIAKGKKEGFYRENLNNDVIAKLYLNSIDFLVNPFSFPPSNYNFSELYKEFINYHLQGIASEKGHQYMLNSQLEENE